MSWSSERLGNVCDLITRGIAPIYLETGGLRVVNQKCVRDHTIDYSFARRHDNVAKIIPAERLLRVGDVLVNSTGTGTLGRVAQVRIAPDEPTTVDTHVTIVRPNLGLFHPDFFGYVMTTIEAALTAAGEGASGQTELPKSKLEKDFEVSFPECVTEQQRIVVILDEAFEAIAAAVAASRRATAAADELFSSFRNTLLSGDEKWIEMPLRHVLSVKHGFAFESKHFGRDGNYVLLTPGNFYESGGFRDRGSAQKRYHGPIPAGFVLKSGMLLVAMTEQAAGLLGSPLLVPDGETYLHNQRLGLIEAVGGVQLDNQFLFHLFNTAAFRQHMHNSATGTKVRHTSPSKIETFAARFPPTVEAQADLAARIDLISNEIDKLRDIYRRKLAALSNLKQSLLARAFSGELRARAAPVADDNEFSTPKHAANIIAFLYWRHERSNRSRFFGHVMAQKTLDLVERVGGVDLGRTPYKDAAGPNDRAHMVAAERWAKQEGFFEFVERSGGGYDFKKLSNHSVMLAAAKTALKPIEGQMDRVTNILVGKDTTEAEVFATALAAWNNLVADGAEASDTAIISEARENWHPDKLAIPISKFQSAIQEIRSRNLVPDGTAKVVRHRQASLL